MVLYYANNEIIDPYDMLVRQYLDSNQVFHFGRINGHSWPCQVWQKYPERNPWHELAVHGMIPRNFSIIRCESSKGTP